MAPTLLSGNTSNRPSPKGWSTTLYPRKWKQMKFSFDAHYHSGNSHWSLVNLKLVGRGWNYPFIIPYFDFYFPKGLVSISFGWLFIWFQFQYYRR